MDRGEMLSRPYPTLDSQTHQCGCGARIGRDSTRQPNALVCWFDYYSELYCMASMNVTCSCVAAKQYPVAAGATGRRGKRRHRRCLHANIPAASMTAGQGP
jgi:hypothetical protein